MSISTYARGSLKRFHTDNHIFKIRKLFFIYLNRPDEIALCVESLPIERYDQIPLVPSYLGADPTIRTCNERVTRVPAFVPGVVLTGSGSSGPDDPPDAIERALVGATASSPRAPRATRPERTARRPRGR